jgi:hypothetical protein
MTFLFVGRVTWTLNNIYHAHNVRLDYSSEILETANAVSYTRRPQWEFSRCYKIKSVTHGNRMTVLGVWFLKLLHQKALRRV